MTEVRLHRSLYGADAVHRVAGMYGNVAQVAVEDLDHELCVRFSQVDPDVSEILLDHFCNHVLAETVKDSRRSEKILAGELL